MRPLGHVLGWFGGRWHGVKDIGWRRAGRHFEIGRLHSLGFELLESRAMLAAVPTVTLSGDGSPLIGASIGLTATFDNAHATDPGFGPFIDLVFPDNGADGNQGADTPDGISFLSANFLGSPVTSSVLTFPNDGGGTGTVNHPYAVDVTGTPLPVTGTAGDTLVVLQLPFGSFTGPQPPAAISILANLSSWADLGTPLSISARAGFQFGNDALANPTTDPSILSGGDSGSDPGTWSMVQNITPRLLTLSKTYDGPENETATGPNFPRQYEVVVDIASGQTITNLDITDLLPNNVVFLGVDSTSPAGTVTELPVGTPANPADNDLTVNYPSVSGSASVAFSFFVDQFDADGVAVINPASGDDASSIDDARTQGTWTPLDGRDPPTLVTSDVTLQDHVLADKSIAIQKGVTNLTSPGGPNRPGDTLQYTLTFQVSDFFAFENVVVDDTISDGQRFESGFAPTLAVTEHAVPSAGAFNPLNVIVEDHFSTGSPAVPPLDGTQRMTFNVSSELTSRTLGGQLLGGAVPVGGTGGPAPDIGTFDGGATTGTIVFRTVIQEEFSDDFPSGDHSVDEGDELDNSVTIDGDVLSYVDLTPTGLAEADGSGASIMITRGMMAKQIYAINGSTTLPSPLRLSPGDDVTYRFAATLPSSDVEDLMFTDYLPLPVLDATTVTVFDDIVSASAPASGRAKFGPTDTFRGISGIVPAITTDATGNSIEFNYGDFDIVSGSTTVVDVLFTVTVNNAPFADGLFLTNQVRRSQKSTNAGQLEDDAIVQIQLGEPVLDIRKGVIATANTDGVFSPTTVGPVAFSAPGTAGYRGSGTIHSNGLTANPIDSDLERIDAGDLVSFAIVVENTGSSRRGAFDVRVRDTVPTGFSIPGGAGLNLTVTDGTGAAMTYVGLGAGLFDAAGGIELTDPFPTLAQPDATDAGALDQYDPTDGRNILVLTYDLVADVTVEPSEVLTNTATLFHYAGADGGPDHTTEDRTDDAEVTVALPTVGKSVIATNRPHTTGDDVAVGEIITYRAVIRVPEGASSDVTFIDTLDQGLAMVAVDSITPSAGLTTDVVGGYAAVLAGATVTDLGVGADQGRRLTIDFGNLTNSNLNNAVDETITVDYRAVVINGGSNDRGDGRNNLAVWNWDGGTAAGSASNVTIVEPALQVQKIIGPPTAQATDTVLVTLDVTHAGASDADAFNVDLADVIPSGMTYVPASLSHTGGIAPNSIGEAGGTITATWNAFALAATSQLQFQATLDVGVQPDQVITNSASAQWTSLPGDVTIAQSLHNSLSVERTGDTGDPGTTDNDYRHSGSDTVTVISPSIDKTLVGTNLGSTLGNDVAIGEIVTYQVELTVPQGTSSNAQIVDNVDAGLAIVDVVSISPSLDLSTDIAGGYAQVLLDADASIPASGSTVTWDFGTLTNSNNNNSVDETITVRYRAVVLNTAGNNRGTGLNNDATYSWSSGSIADSAPNVSVVEGELDVQKTVLPATGQATDTVTITLDVVHAVGSDASAYDVRLADVIPAGLTYVSASLSNPSGLAPTTLGEAGGTVTATWNTFGLGSTSRLQFQATLDVTVQPDQVVTNTVDIDWTSLPGDVTTPQSSNSLSVERTGDPTDPGGTSNDLNDNASDDVTIVSPSIDKTLVGTNLGSTLGNDVAIGEVVTYQVELTVPQGTSSSAQIVDNVDAGLAIVDVVSISPSLGLSTDIAGGYVQVLLDADASIPADGSTVTWDFGTLTNSNNNSSVDETITVRYRAVVLNTAGNNRGTGLNNDATYSWSLGSIADSAPNVSVVEGELDVQKTVLPATGQATDTVTIILDVAHAVGSDASAYDVRLADVIPAGLTYVPASLLNPSGLAPTTMGEAGGTVTATWNTFGLGSTSRLQFQATLDVTVQPDQVVTNTVDIDWTSLPGDVTTPQSSNSLSVERTGDPTDPGGTSNDLNDNASDDVTIVSPALNKSVVSTNLGSTLGNDVAIGEIVTYQVQLTVPQGTSSSAQIVDNVDAGLAIVDVVSISPSLDLSTDISGGYVQVLLDADASIPADGSTVTWDFGTLTNSNNNNLVDETITVRYRAVVLNTAGNNRGTGLNNDATYSWSLGSIADSAPNVTITEPQLQVIKSDSVPATADGDDVVRFTISLQHAAGSDADAFDVRLVDLIDSVSNELTYESGSVNVVNAGGAVSGGVSEVGGDLAITWSTFPLGATSTITFDARVDAAVMPAQTLTNTADVVWSGLPGDVTTPQSSHGLSVERTGDTGDPGAASNDYTTSDSGVAVTLAPLFAKTVVDSSLAHTGDSQHTAGITDLAVGETVTFRVSGTVPEGTIDLQIFDQLPVAPGVLEYVSSVLTFVGGSISVPPGFPTYSVSDSNGDTYDDRLVIDLDDVVNTPDGVVNVDDRIEAEITARVVDIAGNNNGVTLTNQATLDYDSGTLSATADVEIVEPLLNITKAATLASGPPGSTVAYTLTVDHLPASASNAFDLTITDLLSDPNLILVPGSVTASLGTIILGNGVSDTTVRVDLPALPLGQSLVISYDAVVASSLGGGANIPNTGTLSWDNIPGPGGRPDADSDNQLFTTTARQIDLAVVKTDDPDPVVVTGALTYTIEVTNNGPSDASNVTVTDNLPGTVAFVSAVASQGVAGDAGGVVTGNLGSLAAGDSATVTIEVTAPATEGTINNQVTVTATESDTNLGNNSAIEPTEVLQFSTLSGLVYVDVNNDGIKQPGEEVLPGITVTLVGIDLNGQPVNRTTLTTLAGQYLFANVPPGIYLVTESQPGLFMDGRDTVGDAGGAVSANDQFALALPAGIDATGYNFGELGVRGDLITKRWFIASEIDTGGGGGGGSFSGFAAGGDASGDDADPLPLGRLAAGDANGDSHFDRWDIVQVLQSDKYLTGEFASWEEGDWNEDGVFDQRDIVAALQAASYLANRHAALTDEALLDDLGLRS